MKSLRVDHTRLWKLILALSMLLATLSVGVIGEAATAGSAEAAAGTDRLGPDERLNPGGRLVSAGGQYVLAMQGDGNAVVYAAGNRALTSFGWPGEGNSVLIMQGDGNLVLYAPGGRAIWASGTAGNPGAVLIMQGDGNLVIYAPGGRPVWDSGTAGGSSGRPGIVTVGREIQSMGFRVSEHPAFGRVGGHVDGSLHYSGRAIDVNRDVHEADNLDRLNQWIQRRIPNPRDRELLWRVKNHFNHLHLGVRY